MSVKLNSPSPRSEFRDSNLKACVRQIVDRGFSLGKAPLFVLGAGISAKRVPFIGQMANRLVGIICEWNETHSDQPADLIAPETKDILIRQGRLIEEGQASRSDAAEFFSTCQGNEKPMPGIWKVFCQELAFEGLPSSNSGRFRGLFRLTTDPDIDDSIRPLSGPSLAHLGIANLLTIGASHVLNLNYDPLLFLAMSYLRQSTTGAEQRPSHHLISLHTEDDISAYYSSTNREYQPAVVNARGDIFYARCTNDRCPEFTKSRSLDTRYAIHQEKKQDEAFRCSSCYLKSIQLQLSFPGYETKERLVEPVLHRLRDFLGHRVSVIFPIGLSGQWDPYLLSEVFDWSLSYSIPVVDVKPDSGPLAFEAFRHRYFPSIPVRARREGPWYQQWRATADRFMAVLYKLILESQAFELSDVTKKSLGAQPPLRFS
jgi:hypothetical protein